jgi:WD40 repeat protein
LLHRLKLHKVLIKSLSFSFNDNYLISVGGQDDNTIVLWEVETGKALSGNSSGSNMVSEIRFYNTQDNKFLTVHNQQVKLWTADISNKKMTHTDVAMGQIKRKFLTAAIDPTDTYGYVGTQTGDIIEVYLEKSNFKRLGPVKRLFS